MANRIIVVEILACLLAVLAACSGGSSSGKELVPSSQRVPVLNVESDLSAMTYPGEGKILNMRLFEDGYFEYDDFPDYDPPTYTGRNVVVTRKGAKLSEADLNKLLALAESEDFQAANNTYPAFQPIFDSVVTVKIQYRKVAFEKTIEAVNPWSYQYSPALRNKYPDSLIQLLEGVELLKGEAIGRISHQWLRQPLDK